MAKVVFNAPVMLLQIGVAGSAKRRFKRDMTRGFVKPERSSWSSSKEVYDGDCLVSKTKVLRMRLVKITCPILDPPKP